MSDKEQQGDLYRLIQLGRTPGKSVPVVEPFLTNEEARMFYEIRRVPVPRVMLNEEHAITAEAVNDIVGKGMFVSMPDSWPGLSIRQDLSPMLMVNGVGKVEFRGVSIVDTFEKDTVKITAERAEVLNYDDAQRHVITVAAANFGLSPEMLASMNRMETSFATAVVNASSGVAKAMAEKMPNLREAMTRYARHMSEHFSENFYKRDIYLSIQKEVYGMKPKRVLPSGSMRKRRRHYYSDLIKKTIEVDGKLFKNAFPIAPPTIGKETDDGKVEVSMSFKFDQADALVKGQ